MKLLFIKMVKQVGREGWDGVKVSRLFSLKCPLGAQMKMADQELNVQEQFLAGDRNLGFLTPFFLGKGLKIGKKNSKSRRKCLDLLTVQKQRYNLLNFGGH